MYRGISHVWYRYLIIPLYLQAVRLAAVAVFAATFPDRRKGFPARADPYNWPENSGAGDFELRAGLCIFHAKLDGRKTRVSVY